jgi:predicted nucleotide-binding protein
LAQDWSPEVAQHLDRWLHRAGRRRDVFVVYGRNIAARDAVYRFLRSLDLNPLEWNELVRAVGKGAPYVGDVLDHGFARAQACVVLFTGDEYVSLRRELGGGQDSALQPRPNVLFEAGMALAHHPDRTLIVQLGPLRPLSDLTGRHFVQLDDSEASRRAFAERLRTAECSVRMDGDWRTAGDFAGAFWHN